MKNREYILELFKNSNGVSIDTRTIKTNQIFIAINGEHFDGNRYAEEAIEKGAKCAIVDNKTYFLETGKYILVENSLESIQQLAHDYRMEFSIPVIAITGSNGKTTTKELIREVLSSQFEVHATSGNFNNHLGVPLTLLSMPLDTAMLIVEMGASFIGEIEELCQIANPNFGLITNISDAHMEGFGNIESIVKTKTALYKHLAKHKGTVFINKEDDILCNQLSGLDVNKVYYTPESSLKYVIAKPELVWDYIYKGSIHKLKMKLVGKYNRPNIVAAISIGQYFGVAIDDIIAKLISYEPSNNRSQLMSIGSNKFVMDAYNANPASMKGSINSMLLVDSNRKVLILGDMLELGENEMIYHQEIVDFIAKFDWLMVLLVGSRFMKTITTDKFLKFENVQSLQQSMPNIDINNALVLLKGSRGIALEKLLTSFQK